MKNKLLWMLLGLLGFGTSCVSRDEYGSPYDTYTIKGRVTDPVGNPIREIVVSRSEWSETITDDQGTYIFDGEGHRNINSLTFKDKDGPANGGQFLEKSIEVEITQADKTEGGNGWYQGHYLKVVDITLDKEE